MLVCVVLLRHRSENPVIFNYSVEYFLLLLSVCCLLLFLLPLGVYVYLTSSTKSSVVRTLFVIGIVYACASLLYYHFPAYQKQRLFDPYLQIPHTKFTVPIEKGEYAIRILCLGGSTTEGFPTEGSYPPLLEAILRARYPDFDIEVLNGGKQWYSTKHSLINYVTYCYRWKPDIVIVMHALNDLYRSFSPPSLALGGYDDQWTHFYGPSINGAKAPGTFEEVLWRGVSSRLIHRHEADYPLETYVSITMYEAYLRAIVRRVKDDGADVLLVSEPSLYKPEMSEQERKVLIFGQAFCLTRRNDFTEEYPSYQSLANAMAGFNHIVENVASSEHAIFVNAAGGIPKHLQNFKDDCHYTKHGVTVVAEFIADRLIKSQVIEKRAQHRDSPRDTLPVVTP